LLRGRIRRRRGGWRARRRWRGSSHRPRNRRRRRWRDRGGAGTGDLDRRFLARCGRALGGRRVLHLLQGLDQGRRIGKTLRGIVVEHALEDGRGGIVHLGAELAHVRRHARRQCGGAQRGIAHVGIRRAARQQFEEHHAQRVLVGAAIQDVPGAKGLRREVAVGAEHGPDAGQRRAELGTGAGDAQVSDFHMFVFDAGSARQQQVAGLDVAMHHAGLVDRRQPARGFQHPALDLGDAGQTQARGIRHRALQHLHREIGRAFVLADRIDLHHVRMIDPGEDARLAHEALQVLGLAVPVARLQLDRQLALQGRVAGAIDDAHTALPERTEYFEAADLPGESGQGHGSAAHPGNPGSEHAASAVIRKAPGCAA